MSIYLEIERHSGDERRDVVSSQNAQVGIAAGTCPGCGVAPFRIVGAGLFREGYRWKSGGKCVACQDSVGWIYAEPDTIFGEEEDRAMLVHGRPRVY